MRILTSCVTLLLAAACGTSAYASDTDVFAGCDGLGSPANSMRMGFYASGSEQSTIAACDAALAHPKLLPTQALRRARLLRARATAHLKANDLPEALADIDPAFAEYQITVLGFTGDFKSMAALVLPPAP